MDWTLLNSSWTVIMLVAFLAIGRITYECFKDFMVVRRGKINSVREGVSLFSLIALGNLLLVTLFFLYLGLAAIVRPVRWFPNHLELYRDILVGVFMVVAVVIMFSAIVLNAIRDKTITVLDRQMKSQKEVGEGQST